MKNKQPILIFFENLKKLNDFKVCNNFKKYRDSKQYNINIITEKTQKDDREHKIF